MRPLHITPAALARPRPLAGCRVRASAIVLAAAVSLGGGSLGAQSVHEAPASAPATAVIASANEPGLPLMVSGVVVGADGTPVSGASLYVYQTDYQGYYGVKPASDNRNPRLKAFLRSDARGAWSFSTVKPGSYPNSRIPAHIHFEVSAPGHAPKIFEIVFEGDPFLTAAMRSDPGFSVRPIDGGKVTERIVLK
jgi:protocatechuate 3,4-dioxygenase beta subunit